MSSTQKPTKSLRRLLQNCFRAMKQRCYQETHHSYADYGGRGIKICPEWLGGGTSEAFVQWGLANGYEPGLQIDRIDTNGNYTPANCHFVTPKQNSRNFRRNVYAELDGVMVQFVVALEAARPDYTVREHSIMLKRLRRGWSAARALTTPIVERVKA